VAIVVARVRGGSRDLLRKYRVLVDGVEVGRLRQGETFSHDAAEGEHTVQLKIDWGSSPAFRFMLNAAESAYFVCAPGTQAPLDAMTTSRGQYIDLRPAPVPVEPWDVPGPLRSQRPVGLAIAFFGGGAFFIGGAVWYLTGLARPAAEVVTMTGFVVTLAAMTASRLGRMLHTLSRRRGARRTGRRGRNAA
jgi:hypothetical protein